MANSSCIDPDYIRNIVLSIIWDLINNHELQAALKDCDADWLGKGAKVPLCSDLVEEISQYFHDCDDNPLSAGTKLAKCSDLKTYLDCDGVELPAGTQLAKCSDLPDAIGSYVRGCDGAPLPNGAKVPTCTEVPEIVRNHFRDCDGNPLPPNAQIALCSDIPDTAVPFKDCGGENILAGAQIVTCDDLTTRLEDCCSDIELVGCPTSGAQTTGDCLPTQIVGAPGQNIDEIRKAILGAPDKFMQIRIPNPCGDACEDGSPPLETYYIPLYAA